MKKPANLIILALILLYFTASGQFPRDRKIDAAEYFINTDPGTGNGIPVSIGATPLWEVTINIDNLQVAAGSVVYVRFHSTNGTWSAPRAIKRRDYFPDQGAHIEYGEYYINHDPGPGLGTAVNVNSSGLIDLNGLDLQKGDRVFFRIRDSYNRWSASRPAKFDFKEIDYAEYTVKHESGDSASTLLMNVSQTNPSTCVYTAVAVSDTNTIVKNDVVYVRMRTSDMFYSKWVKSAAYVPPPPNELSETDPAQYLEVYPNPFRENIHVRINLTHACTGKLSFFDMTGRCISVSPEISFAPGGNQVNVISNQLTEGMYTLILLIDNQVFAQTRILKI